MEKVDYYGKWDDPEDTNIAFEKVKSGEWDLARFQAWEAQLRLDEYRSAAIEFGEYDD